MTETRFPAPTAETVLPCVPAEWATTQAIFQRWLGATAESSLSRRFRNQMRAEVFLQLDRHFLAGRVEKRQPQPDRVEWRRKRFREDDFTATVDGAAAYERFRGGHAGPW